MRKLLSLIVVLVSIAPGRTTLAKVRPRQVEPAPSFIAFHTARVQHDLMMFHPDYPGLMMALRREDRTGAETERPRFSFVSPSRADDPFEVARQRDRLLLFRDTHRQTSSTALGLGLFAATTMMSAHLPDPLRVIFDGPVHLGPAIFDDGGMGAGIAGTGP